MELGRSVLCSEGFLCVRCLDMSHVLLMLYPRIE